MLLAATAFDPATDLHPATPLQRSREQVRE
jgi:hypothetical protein